MQATMSTILSLFVQLQNNLYTSYTAYNTISKKLQHNLYEILQ